jgi:Holliday junction resolvase RusA-like endonuclease
MEIFDITPQTKPRMTRSDKWKKRDCVTRYFEYRDNIKELGIDIPEAGSHVVFVIPMPKSWSKKRKEAFNAAAHQGSMDKAVKNDLDNLLKGLMDAIFKEDSWIWDIRISKIWGYTGKIYTVNFSLTHTWLTDVRYDVRGYDNLLGVGHYGHETKG